MLPSVCLSVLQQLNCIWFYHFCIFITKLSLKGTPFLYVELQYQKHSAKNRIALLYMHTGYLLQLAPAAVRHIGTKPGNRSVNR